MKKINIAIDGPSGAGKSSVSEALAKKLNYIFINTGSFYRAVALYSLRNNIDPTDENEVIANLQTLNPHSITINNQEQIFLDGENITNTIRADQISKYASQIAAYKLVREFVVNRIQHITKNDKGYIMDGRDTTFRIMPYAEVKIFLTASASERAKRRIKQNYESGYNTDYQTVYEEVKQRDYQDSHRATDPLHKVEDAIEIDCTEMNFEAVLNKIIEIVESKVNDAK
ncbi:(d)CMP kinase [Mycoplasmopsis columbinasalis]|uniref:Cytidylate kinase n=1 Tax=Mycoplasmopsis columbinasalis TaxID=114880 RepID=A0A449BAK6_9BACT|nr:(d)CMP kinase [Mycoplasmopsis columbinasalis]VEU78234.1 cytidylate kinase [Mycoplasmopsis columbinasalis]